MTPSGGLRIITDVVGHQPVREHWKTNRGAPPELSSGFAFRRRKAKLDRWRVDPLETP